MFLHSLLFGKIMILLDPARLAFRTSFKSQVTIYQQLKSKRDYIVKGSKSFQVLTETASTRCI